jgi:hypothetical protein
VEVVVVVVKWAGGCGRGKLVEAMDRRTREHVDLIRKAY